MSRRIREDHAEFIDVVRGKIDDQLKKYIKNGNLIGWRPKGGKFIINLPRIDIPRFVYGKDNSGWGRGPGDLGDVIGRDKKKGKGNQPGELPGDVVPVGIDLEQILDYLQEELGLPFLKPKDNSQVFDEKIIYNGIRKTGPESLRHNRRTMKQAMLRTIQSGDYNHDDPCVVPIQEDKRYKSWNVKNIPRSNAVVFFARDWSGSMDDGKCELVMNTCWWIDQWIRRFYERTETVYIGHDTEAKEIDQEKFYKMRYGGGTKCSSAFELIKNKINLVFKPNMWNIYIFYFSDGENFNEDNHKVIDLIKELKPSFNLLGMGQVYSWHFDGESDGYNLLKIIENEFAEDKSIRTYDCPDSERDPSHAMQMIKKFLGK